MDEPKELTLAELTAADATRVVEAVEVPEWGGRVFVRELDAYDRDKLDGSLYREGQERPELADYRVRLVAAALCTADGTPYFKAGDPKAVHVLSRKSAAPIRRVYDAAARLNRVRKEDAEEGKGDSGGAPDAGSPSASPSPSGGTTLTDSSAG